MLSLQSRSKAGLCHLAALTVVGSLLLPFLIGRLDDENYEFVETHSLGAMFYQALGLMALLGPVVLAYLFADPSQSFERSALLGFASIVWFFVGVVYVLGVVWLSLQAWSGADFDLPPFNRFVYGAPSGN